MNRYPLWKYLIIFAVLIPAFIYALPNLYGNDPALEIKTPKEAPAISVGQVTTYLKQGGMQAVESMQGDGGLVRLRFANVDAQEQAQKLLRDKLPKQAEVAMVDWSAAPAWLQVSAAKA